MLRQGRVVSVHVGAAGQLEKSSCESIEVALNGIVGDRHRGASRECWEGDKQPEGTVRRNERQWSAVAAEELATITEAMNLSEPLRAETVGANLCLGGIADLSRLPRGTLLTFESGAVLMVEEYNPPCADMGASIVQCHATKSGKPLPPEAFSDAAKFLRGVVGIVEVAGVISVGDTVTVTPEQLPLWLRR